jgi:glycosyltransferase involved in cell wall biosynthesis
MLNIAFFVTTSGWGGLEMNFIQMASGLVNLGYDVKLIVRENSRLHTEASKRFEVVKAIKRPGKYFDFRSARILSRILKNGEIDTIVVHDNRDLDVVSWMKRLFCRNIKVIYQQHMQIGINKKDVIHTQRFKCIDSWVSPLIWLKEEIEKNTKFPAERINIIPFAADTERFSKQKYTLEEAREKLDLSPKVPLIGIIGRISQKKGQGFVIKAIQELIKKGTGVELLIFGSATIDDAECQAYDKEIRDYVKQHKLDKVIHFRHYSADVEQFYCGVDISVIASEKETFGMVTIEAMLSELPIVAADTGGSPEILDRGRLGRLYAYENTDDFNQQLKWILDNPEDARKMATLAKGKAVSEYSSKSQMIRFSRVIKRLHGVD